jgi:predicted DNA-binding transcriptional regulator AlpA
MGTSLGENFVIVPTSGASICAVINSPSLKHYVFSRRATMLQQQSASEPSRQITQSQLSDESLITGKQLREFLGCCSEMHIWRLLNKEKYQPLAFPKPIKINDRNYWRLGAVRQWIRHQEAQSQKVSPDKGGGELAPDGEAPFVSQKRPRPVARREPHVALLSEAPAYVAPPAGIAGIGASRKQSLPSKRTGRSRARVS